MSDSHEDLSDEVIFGAEFNCFQTPIRCDKYPENNRTAVLNALSVSKESLSGWALSPQNRVDKKE